MSEVRLIDANALKYKNLAEVNGRLTYVLTAEEIDNAPTVDVGIEIAQEREKLYEETKKLYILAKTLGKDERPRGEWRTRTDTEWHFECNQCKGLSPWKAQFCGVCGADMRKGGAE